MLTRRTCTLLLLITAVSARVRAEPRTVHFPSEDGKTRLVGYLFRPSGGGPHAAIVLLHGRAGPYSSLAKGRYNASTLSKRHKEWGALWAEHGYVALLVDSFGPRGFPEGFARGSYDERPAEVSEQTVRPLDAYGSLRYLRTLPDVDPARAGVQGWSNGGMTVLVTISEKAPGIPPTRTPRRTRSAGRRSSSESTSADKAVTPRFGGNQATVRRTKEGLANPSRGPSVDTISKKRANSPWPA